MRSSQKEVRILIADDHPIVREGLVAVLALENDLKVVGQAHDGEEACRLYKELLPDILILDLRMPKKDGIQVVSELMSERPRPRIIVLTNSAKAEDLRRALTAGAKSYLLKGAEPDQVCETIRGVDAGKSSYRGMSPRNWRNRWPSLHSLSASCRFLSKWLSARATGIGQVLHQ